MLDRLDPGSGRACASHAGIGLVLGRDERSGDLVLGPTAHHLDDDTVDDADPLAALGPHAADRLPRTSSSEDPDTGEGVAFAQPIGFLDGLLTSWIHATQQLHRDRLADVPMRPATPSEGRPGAIAGRDHLGRVIRRRPDAC